jgi:histidinol-phosphatase (PHP family)
MDFYKLDDCHIHAGVLIHTKGTLQSIIDKAYEVGYKNIAITEHFSYSFSGEGDFKNKNFDTLKLSNEVSEKINAEGEKSLSLDGYISLLQSMKNYAQKKGLTYLNSLEVDFFSEYSAQTKPVLKEKNFDFLLGSLHYIKDFEGNYIHFSSNEFQDYCKLIDDSELYEKYFSEIKNLIKSGMFNCVAHLDFLKKKYSKYSEENSAAYFEEILELLLKKDVGVEANVKGYLDIGEPYPSVGFLKKYLKEGGSKIYFGSDSHSPDEIFLLSSKIRDLKNELGFI